MEEAKLHPEWVKHHKSVSLDCEFQVVIISPTAKLDKVAEPFSSGVFFLMPDDVRSFATRIVDVLRKLRAKFAGRDYAEAEAEFAAEILAAKLDIGAIKAWATSLTVKEQVPESTKK